MRTWRQSTSLVNDYPPVFIYSTLNSTRNNLKGLNSSIIRDYRLHISSIKPELPCLSSSKDSRMVSALQWFPANIGAAWVRRIRGTWRAARGDHRIRPVSCITFVAFVSAFYILGCRNSGNISLLIRHSEWINPGEKGNFFFAYLNTSSSKAMNKTGYLVYSPSCRIPDFPPFHDSIKSLYEKQEPVNCTSLPPLTTVSRTETGTHVLHLHKRYFSKYSSSSNFSCCYNLIFRKDFNGTYKNKNFFVDNRFKYTKCISFDDDVAFNGQAEFLRVTCKIKKDKTNVTNIYTNMHAFVGLKPEVQAKMLTAFENTLDKRPQILSVMIVGIDSISRLNMIRTMPKTVKHLEQNGWYVLKGYNKMDDNTFPNLMAILAGMTYEHLRQDCWPNSSTPLDKCPLLWRNFSSNGYITAYAEDGPKISSFNFNKVGFLKTPTDYYLRPFMLAAEKSLNITLEAGLAICLGPASTADHVLNYSLDFASTFAMYPSFSLFWLNSFSHNDLNTPTTMDGRIRDYLAALKETGALNTTMVIFLSDHGMRFGKIRETYIGYIEERLPFIYFWLPEWFKEAHPQKINNLITNAHRLTSPYDVHMTLVEVLGGKTTAKGCPKCVSLFEEVPWNRPCIDAGITNHWCTCAEYKTISPGASAAQVVSKFVVGEINAIIQNFTNFLENGTHCAQLHAKRVLTMRSKVFSEPIGHKEFIILLQTIPGDALFEATVSHRYTLKIVDSISRINAYDKQSQCVSHAYARKYCFCEENSESTTTAQTTKSPNSTIQ